MFEVQGVSRICAKTSHFSRTQGKCLAPPSSRDSAWRLLCTIVQFWYPSTIRRPQYVVSTVIIGKNRKSFNGETNVELQARLNPER